MPSSAKEILQAVYELLIRKEWTQRQMARDARGNPCDLYSEKAECFCLAGAINKVLENNSDAELYHDVRRLLRHQAVKQGNLHGFVAFNDHPNTTKSDVLALIRRTINNID